MIKYVKEWNKICLILNSFLLHLNISKQNHDSTLKIFTIAPLQCILEPTIGSSTIDTACTMMSTAGTPMTSGPQERPGSGALMA